MAPHAPDTLPLSALLSQALVAFTIEFDNEAEHRAAHRTTRNGGPARGPWLVSLAMWATGLRFAGEEPITVAELERRARAPTNLDGLRRWGYVTFSAAPGSAAPPATGRPGRKALIAVTPAGRRAQEVWEPLPAEIEQRWRERFSDRTIDPLRRSLETAVAAVEGDPPDCMPILGHGLWTARESPRLAGLRVAAGPAFSAGTATELPLFTLLSRALLAFAAEYEAQAPVSLAVAADVVRVLEDGGTALRDLPARSGVAKAGLAMAAGWLERRGLAVTEPVPGAARGRQIRLTARGAALRLDYPGRCAAVERGWKERLGAGPVDDLRGVLEPMIGDGTPDGSPLWAGLVPYPGGWRASVRPPGTLPHFPMVLHRGGYPDGS